MRMQIATKESSGYRLKIPVALTLMYTVGQLTVIWVSMACLNFGVFRVPFLALRSIYGNQRQPLSSNVAKFIRKILLKAQITAIELTVRNKCSLNKLARTVSCSQENNWTSLITVTIQHWYTPAITPSIKVGQQKQQVNRPYTRARLRQSVVIPSIQIKTSILVVKLSLSAYVLVKPCCLSKQLCFIRSSSLCIDKRVIRKMHELRVSNL